MENGSSTAARADHEEPDLLSIPQVGVRPRQAPPRPNTAPVVVLLTRVFGAGAGCPPLPGGRVCPLSSARGVRKVSSPPGHALDCGHHPQLV